MTNANNTKNNKMKAEVQIRLYYDDSEGWVDADLAAFASGVIGTLTGKIPVPKLKESNQENPTLPDDSVKFETVNLSDSSDRRSPSQKAIDAARNKIAVDSVGTNPKSDDQNRQKLKKALFGYIVDCWIQFKPTTGQ